MKIQWDYNIWTGDSYHTLSDKERIVRYGMIEPYLYYAEFWGDYSADYPKKSPCFKTYSGAKKWLARILIDA